MPRVTEEKPQANTGVTVNVTPPAQPRKERQEADSKAEKPPRWFFDEIQEIAAGDWGKIYSLELHRMEPKVPGVPGSKGYLNMYLEPITLASVQQRYGGGKFRLNLCKNGRYWTSHDFDIEGAPIYDASRERATAAPAGGSNDSSLVRILEEQYKKVIEVLERARTDDNADSPAMTKAVDILSTAYNEGIKAVREDNKPAPAPDLLKQLTPLIALLTPLFGFVKPLFERMLVPQNPLEELTKLGTVIDALDKIRGTNSGGGGGDSKPKDWKAMLAEALMSKGPEVIREIRETLEAQVRVQQERRATAEAQERLVGRLPAGAPGAPAPAAPGTPAPTSSPLRTVPINGAPPAAGVVPGQATAGPMPGPEMVQPFDVTLAVTNFIKTRVVAILVEDADAGDTVEEIAEHLVDFLEDASPETIDEIRNNSPVLLNAFFAEDPILRVLVAHPKWSAVLDAARAYIRQGVAEPAEPAPA